MGNMSLGLDKGVGVGEGKGLFSIWEWYVQGGRVAMPQEGGSVSWLGTVCVRVGHGRASSRVGGGGRILHVFFFFFLQLTYNFRLPTNQWMSEEKSPQGWYL